MQDTVFNVERASALDGGLEGKVIDFSAYVHHDAHTVNEHEIEGFLADDVIGPISGLSKRLADTKLYKEAYRRMPDGTQIFTKTQEAKICYGALGIYIHRGENALAQQIIDDEDNPLTETAMAKLNLLLAQDGTHRFERLGGGYSDLHKRREELEHKLTTNLPLLEHQLEHLDDADLRHQHDELKYRTLRELFGIALAVGEMDEVMDYAKKLEEFPERERFERTRHVSTVIKYLRNGGEQTLREAGHQLKQRLEDNFGTKTREGRFGKYNPRKWVKEAGWATSTEGAAAIAVGIVAAYAQNDPEEAQVIANLGPSMSDQMVIAFALTAENMNRKQLFMMKEKAKPYVIKAVPTIYHGAKRLAHEYRETVKMLRDGYSGWLDQRQSYRQ